VACRCVLEIEIKVQSQDPGHLTEIEGALADFSAKSDHRPVRQRLFGEQREVTTVLWVLEWENLPQAMAFVNQLHVAAFLGSHSPTITISSCRLLELGAPAASSRCGEYKPRLVRGRLLRFPG
jgi:hypothetical protein